MTPKGSGAPLLPADPEPLHGGREQAVVAGLWPSARPPSKAPAGLVAVPGWPCERGGCLDSFKDSPLPSIARGSCPQALCAGTSQRGGGGAGLPAPPRLAVR